MEDEFIEEQIKTMFKVSKRLQLAFSDVKKLTTKYLLKVKKIKTKRDQAIRQFQEKKKKQQIQMKKKAKLDEKKARKQRQREQAEQAEKERKKNQQQEKPQPRSIISILKPNKYGNKQEKKEDKKEEKKQDKNQKKKLKAQQKQKQKHRQRERERERQRQIQREKQKEKGKQQQRQQPQPQGMNLIQKIKNKNRQEPKKQVSKPLQKPKQPQTPYYKFLRMKKAEIWSTIGTMPAQHTTKIMRTVWQRMSDEERRPFVQQYEVQKAKYQRQIFLYYNPKKGQARKTPEQKNQDKFEFDFIDQLSRM